MTISKQMFLHGFIHKVSDAGTFVTCEEEEGEPLNIDLIADNPCIKCYCRSGITDCVLQEDCPSSYGCHNILKKPPADSCCKEVCLGCTYKNMTIKSGDMVKDSTDPCIALECQGGVLTHSTIMCTTTCKEPVYIPGQCCPVCKGCAYKGKTYADGILFTDNKDPCIFCKCSGGNIQCSKKACAQLNCPKQYLIAPENSRCCPTCSGRKYNSFMRGTVICLKRTCPRLKCTFNKWLPPAAGECCPRCPPPKRKCKVDGKKRKHGVTWFENQCTQCNCEDGVSHCWQEDCSAVVSGCPVRTHELQYISGSCCPQCIEISATCFVFGDPHYRTFDGILYTFQGSCQYTLAQQCSSSKRTFSIQVKNAVWHDKTQYAYTHSVYVKTKYLSVKLEQQLDVQVNNHHVKLPFIKLGHISILKRGHMVVVSTHLGVTVVWDGHSYVEVSVPQRYKNKMCGLCGNYNGISEDDFIGRSKTNYSTAVAFANSWQRDQSTCDIGHISNEIPPLSCSGVDYATLNWIGDRCATLNLYIASQCRTMEDLTAYHTHCIDKLCNCDDHRLCYCRSAKSLLKVCPPISRNLDFGHDLQSICSV
ncbi:BMP-binding endothelial regulator protein-like [Watersipora subatra]|uniref:BMP-binding endothelial regulator protein-like n=1 Tax=Watersipora subatra TaxID=2589382 RepID=UPI00355C6308